MKIVSGILLLLVWISCTKSEEKDNCYATGQALIDTVTGPSVANLGQPINVHVMLPFADGCYGIKSVPLNRINDSLYEISARYESMGCVCTQIAGTFDSTITFQPSRTGILKFRYQYNGQSYRYYQVTVQ